MKRTFLAAIAAAFISIVPVVVSTATAQQPTAISAAQQVMVNACGKMHKAEVKAAPQGVNPKLAAYHGVWTGGEWDNNGGCNALVVEDVRPDGKATVLYIFPPYSEFPEGHFRKTDAVLDNKGNLYFTSAKGSQVWYTLQSDGNGLDGVFQPKSGGTALKFKSPPRRLATQAASR